MDNTQDSEGLYENYLTSHFSHVVNDDTFQRKNIWLRYNHRPYFPENKAATLLEIGPGYGAFLHLLNHDLGYADVHGVDISREVVDQCNKVLPESTDLTTDTVQYLTERNGQYDRIFLFHVLEHVPKLAVIPFLKAVLHALKPEGRVVIEVPNMANPITGLNVRYTDFTHEIGFTDLSLQYILEKAGFKNTIIYGCKVPPVSIVRAAQLFAQKSLETAFKFMLRAYMPTRPSIVTHILGASGQKLT